MKPRVLIIDDDEELCRLLTSYLSQFDLEVLSARDPVSGLELLRANSPALLVLDVMLPGRTGLDLCRDIRQSGTPQASTPIIMLTARGNLSDRVVGLELGADDYLAKPFEPRELVARIQSVLRRTQGELSVRCSSVLVSGELRADRDRATAFLGDADLQLTTAEIGVLLLLMERAGQTLSRDDIFQHLRGAQWDSLDRSVDMVVSRLRHKLREDSRQPRFLKTVWGEGYRFVGQVSEG